MELFCSKCLTVNNSTNRMCINCGEMLDGSVKSELKMNRIKRADFWIRLMAFIIDLFIIVLVWSIFSFVTIKLLPFVSFPIEGNELKVILYIIGIVMMIIYNVIMEISERQATIGKQLFKLTVGDIKGNVLSLKQSIVRTFAKIVTCLTLGTGYILVLFSKEKQAIHDIMADTYVFKEL